jgi:hypothetical protein
MNPNFANNNLSHINDRKLNLVKYPFPLVNRLILKYKKN